MRLKQILQFLGVVAIIALPATTVNLAHRITGTPFLGPFGLTQEELANYGGPTDQVSIAIHVDWGIGRRGRPTRAELRDFIVRAMMIRTADFFIAFRDAPGTGIGITLVVGPNRFGPYPPGRLHEGIVPATVALEMTREARS